MTIDAQSADLAAFIHELDSRLERGDFAGHPPIRLLPELELGDVERAVRVMLADIDFYHGLRPAERRFQRHRRRHLARQLLALRERLGGVELNAEVVKRG